MAAVKCWSAPVGAVRCPPGSQWMPHVLGGGQVLAGSGQGPVGRRVVVAAAIIRDGRLLAARRSHPPGLAGGWELPGGKVEPGEAEPAALVREIREELGVAVRLGPRVGGDWPLGPYLLRVWLASIVGAGEPQPLQQHDALAWVGPSAVDDVDWLPGDLEPARAAARAITWSGPHHRGR